MAGIKVRLIRSRAARSRDQLATLTGLGLHKLGQERILPDNPSTLGACAKLRHMVAWERVEASSSLADATLALYRDPRHGRGEVRFAPRAARFLRLDPGLPARAGALEIGP